MKRNLTVRDFLKFETARQVENFLSHSANVEYCGTGSSRTVYRISTRRVIKVSIRSTWTHKGAGEAQNRREVQVTNKYGDSNLFARVIWYHPKYIWVISEFARDLKKWAEAETFEKDNWEKIQEADVGDLCGLDAFGKIGKRTVVKDYGYNDAIQRFYKD